LFNLIELVVLGAVAGFTIFLGLPVALMGANERLKGFLNALAIGILVFLIIDVFGHAWSSTTDAAVSAFRGDAPDLSAVIDLLAMFGGLTIGFASLVAYERRYLGATSRLDGIEPKKLATMIALGIGAHNLSEGLAIGQSYASGAIALAIVLVIGFGAHNATEGFGITAPLAGSTPGPGLAFLVRVLLVGGSPTFIGTILGSLFYSPIAYIFFLSLAGGALVYVSLTMFGSGRRKTDGSIIMTGIFVGLCAGFLTDLIVSLGGA
jgi:ZIP family zinc transporter